MTGFLFGTIFAGMVLYINTVSIMKKIKNEKNTEWNTLFGCFLVAFILYSIFIVR